MAAEPIHLSRRERQIMDVLYERGSATAAEVRESLPDAPSYSAVRATLRVLEEKGHLKHSYDGPRYLYSPRVPRDRARRSALERLVKTFFSGSVEGAVAALLDMEASELTPEELDRIAKRIEEAKRREP